MSILLVVAVVACSSSGGNHPVGDAALDLSPQDQDRPDESAVDHSDDRSAAADAGVPLDTALAMDAMPSDKVPAIDAAMPADADGADIPSDGGDSASSNACRPACIEKVFGPCAAPKTGTCANTGKVVCYSNGVKMATMLLDGGASEPFAMVTLLKPDGTMCGWYTNSVGTDGNVYLIYYDPNGVEIGRQQRVVPDAASGDLLYSCDGQSLTITSAQLQSAACQHVQAHDCPMGTCS